MLYAVVALDNMVYMGTVNNTLHELCVVFAKVKFIPNSTCTLIIPIPSVYQLFELVLDAIIFFFV